MKLLAPLKKFILFRCYSTQPTYIYSKDSKGDERNGDDFSTLSACRCSFPCLLARSGIPQRYQPTHPTFRFPRAYHFPSSCLIPLNVFARANSYCYPSYKLWRWNILIDRYITLLRIIMIIRNRYIRISINLFKNR